MNKSRRRLIAIIIGASVILVAVFYIILYIVHNRNYPSVIDDSYMVASDVLFRAEISVNGKEINCAIENHSDDKIIMGDEMYLEKENEKENDKDDVWYEIANCMGKRADERISNALAYEIQKDGCYLFSIDLSNYKKLSKGHYRIVKKIMSERNKSRDARLIVIAEIDV